jgi:hypothetical protein
MKSLFYSSVVRGVLGGWVVLLLGLMLRCEGQTLIAPTAPPAPSGLVAQGRKQPRYQVFAAHCVLPVITVVDGTTLAVAGPSEIIVGRLDRLTLQEKEALADRFEVPVRVMEDLVASFPVRVAADVAEVSDRLCRAVVDYKYLLERWTDYRPGPAGAAVKAEALLALEAGDTEKAWTLYAALPRPAAPGALRAVVQN